jgi:phage terminase large subunit GpA-like protein
MSPKPQPPESALPGFTPAAEIIAAASEVLRPPLQITVADWAEQNRQLRNAEAYSGPWRNSMAPHTVEPMNRTQSRAVDAVVVVSCAQAAKTEIGLNVVGHGIECRPRDFLVIQYSREMAIDFARDRIMNKMLVPSKLDRFLGSDRSDKGTLQKTFPSKGMRVIVGWPVAGQLASRPVPAAWLDERDRMPNDINGEGDPVALLRKRLTTFGRNGILLVTSSPKGMDPLDGNLDADEASAILALFYEGDQNLWTWICESCSEPWTPGFDEARRPTLDHLDYKRDSSPTPAEAREKAVLVCPHCGHWYDDEAKARANASGVWVPRGRRLTADGHIEGPIPATRTASYWFAGLANPFVDIGAMAEELVVAERHWERTQDEEKLKTCYNATFGMPYRPRHAGAAPLLIEELEKHRSDYELGTVPEGMKFLTMTVDVQTRYFAVQVTAWDEDARSAVVDRFDLKTLPDQSNPDPANVAEHWDMLVAPLLTRGWPLASDAGKELPLATIAIDTGGASGEDEKGRATSGVAEQARNFARRMFAAGIETWRLMLVKGASVRTAPMLPTAPTWETDDSGKRRPDAVPVYVIGVHSLKNVIDARLRLDRDQPGYVRFPSKLPDSYLDELTAERKIKGSWKKTAANESWDLTVYGEAARQRLRVERVSDWQNPPVWATPRDRQVLTDETETRPTPPASPVRGGRRVRNAGLSNGRN